MSFGPISWAALVHYCEHYGLANDVIDTMWIVIKELDEHWLKAKAEEAKNKTST